jgi:2-C-methyl-D-erythritol 4-phosphate cytidylyltransferase
VIVVAGGAGIRAGGGTPKQYRTIGGVPMVLRAAAPFLRHPEVRRVVLVLPAADVDAPPRWLGDALAAHEASSAEWRLAAGGSERAHSVAAGLAALGDDVRTVLVHDAARPFVERTVIDGVITAARAGEAAIAALPLGDTLKAADPADPERAVRTIPREHLWRAQTPQGFPLELIREAHARSAAEGIVATDDAMLVELLGHRVRLVPDSTRNFKVTTADDLALAELLAAAR